MKTIQKFDVIITTNNRADSIKILVKQILKNEVKPEKIIIVDSSLQENSLIQKYQKVYYIHSSHPNQPYQRYLGYLASKSPFLIYFDDDMEIVDNKIFEKVMGEFEKEALVGVAINFINNNIFLQKKVPKSKFKTSEKRKFFYFNILKYMTGQVALKDGKYGFNGLKGKQPEEGGYTEWVSGGAFAVRKDVLYCNFNFTLFDLYKNHLGKGEDGIIGFTLSKLGKIKFNPDVLLLHNDKQDSVYTKDFFSFSQRVIYSRLYLSYEFARLNNGSKQKAILLYHWYVLWRVLGLLLNQLFHYDPSRKEILKGYLSGWKKTFTTNKDLKKFQENDFWKKEAFNDLK